MDGNNQENVKQIKIRKDFNPARIIYEGLARFEQNYGIKPIGLLLGPDDYKYFLEFREEGELYGMKRVHLIQPPHILGLPYRIKATNGIEFEIEEKHWSIFAKKE